MKTLAARALFLVSLGLVVYAVFAHLVAARGARVYAPRPIALHFTSDADLDVHFDRDPTPDLAVARKGDVLRIWGSCTRAGVHSLLRGKPMRLVPSKSRLRFRSLSLTPLAVTVGFEHPEGPGREIRFGAALDGSRGELRLVGDLATVGAKPAGDALVFRSSEPKIEAGSDAPFHEIALTLEPDAFLAIAEVDGMVVRSVPAAWDAGLLVRPTFGVTCSGTGPVDVEIAELAWEPVIRHHLPLDLDDKFSGSVFDTRWRVSRAAPDVVESTLVLGGRGLEVTGRARNLTGVVPFLSLMSPRVRAETFRGSVEADLASFREGGIFVSVTNSYVGPFFRLLSIGVFEKDGRLVPFTTDSTSMLEAPFRMHDKAFPTLPAATGRVSLEMTFDALTRVARTLVNGVVITEGPAPFQPHEDITFQAGVNANGPGADMRFRVDRVRFVRENR